MDVSDFEGRSNPSSAAGELFTFLVALKQLTFLSASALVNGLENETIIVIIFPFVSVIVRFVLFIVVIFNNYTVINIAYMTV